MVNVERVNIIGMEIIMSRERLLYIDIARGISIILVVFGHIVDLTPFEKFFFSFHVPVFFYDNRNDEKNTRGEVERGR